MPDWLRSSSPAIVRAVLLNIVEASEPDLKLIPHLKEIYLSGAPELSALAIRVAGIWRLAEGVAWIQEKILQNQPLTSDQIGAMIETLGLIPGETAYDLLKATEKSMAGKTGTPWMSYYDALLSHEKREDIETLVILYVDADQDESLRRNAMQLLIHRTDPVLNPSDLLFGNVPRVQEHLATRLDLLVQAAGDVADFAAAKDVLQELRPYLSVFRSENVSVAWAHLQPALEVLGDAQAFEKDLIRCVAEARSRCKPNSEESFVLAALGLCGLLSGLMEHFIVFPSDSAPWRERLSFLFTDHFLKPVEREPMLSLLRDAPHDELVAELAAVLKSPVLTWKTYQAVEVLGLARASEGAGTILSVLERVKEPSFMEIAERALKRIGLAGSGRVIPLLDSSSRNERTMALRILSMYPTSTGVEEISNRFSKLFEEDAPALLQAVQDMGDEAFLPLLEKEYRAGEWRTAQAVLQLCRIHGRSVESLKEIEREVVQHQQFLRQQESLLTRGFRDWPDRVDLDLQCRQCGRKYSYSVREIHLHPHRKSEVEAEALEGLPYQAGVVICDDLRCKNCNALNDLAVTPEAIGQITTESLKLLALHRSKVSVPPYYPVKQVETADREGKILSLVELERENVDGSLRNSTQPQAQLVLGKFYEYVKVFPKARHAFLKTLDLDAQALEAMAGLARLDHAEGKFEEAYDWIDRCYRELANGHVHVAKEPREFKKAVREKRRELARSLGIHAEDEPVNIRFQMETSEFPKNRPCPCGSGKKYKLCCMGKDQNPAGS
jgi:tetratricopeptide (TPR) repeat protein